MDVKLDTDTSLSITWKQTSIYNYPNANYLLEVAIDNDVLKPIQDSFQEKLYFSKIMSLTNLIFFYQTVYF